MKAKKGDWVEIHQVVLRPEERAPALPPETQLVPLEARIKGFLVADAEIGAEVTIETVIGRRVSGTLLSVLPPYLPTFGSPIPELLPVGQELRALLGQTQEQP